VTGPAAVIGGLADLLGEEPIVLVDVGARGGIPDRWRHVEPWLRTIGFEPDARSLDAIERSDRMMVLPTALDSRAGSLELHLTAEESNSSVLMPNRSFLSRFPAAARFEVVDSVAVEADTLDHQLAQAGIDRLDAIKLDTQGNELMVLEGARETLTRGVFGIEVEVELNPMYEEQPLLADVDRFLRPFGYELFAFEPRGWKYRAGEDLALARGQIVWADATYVLGPDRALPFRNVEALARAVVVCLVCGLGDYALALLESAGDVGSGRDRLVDAVRAFDSTSGTSRYGVATRISARDVRRLQELSRRTGIKPAKHLRAALRAWLDARDAEPG
jgi:FkbM family methyltransferase